MIDVFGFSPDIGKFVIRDGKYYDEYGRIFEKGSGIRSMPSTYGSHENYADWSDEKRAEVYAKEVFASNKRKEEKLKQDEARDLIIEQAKSKLTNEEWDAIVNDIREQYY